MIFKKAKNLDATFYTWITFTVIQQMISIFFLNKQQQMISISCIQGT